MRINPISMTYSRQNLRPQNQNNNQKQNINFGRFADDRARKMVYEYLRVDRGDSWDKEAFDYLDETPFVTIKSAVSKDGKPFVYAVAERGAIDRHENRDMFDKMLNSLYNGLARLRPNREAREVGVTDEPGFLTTIRNFTNAHNLYANFCDCEDGYYGKRYGSSSETSEPQEFKTAEEWAAEKLGYYGNR